MVKKTNGRLSTTLNFVSCRQRANGCIKKGPLGTVVKILYFAVENGWPFGYNCKVSYSAIKKRMSFFFLFFILCRYVMVIWKFRIVI